MEILIFWDTLAPEGLERPVCSIISDILSLPVRITESPLILTGYSPVRNQYDAQAVLTVMDTYRRRFSFPGLLLLVTGGDLFMEGHPHLFGLARPSTMNAVVSAARLSGAQYNRDDGDDGLADRLSKEACHEIGHLFGLPHCTDPACIMWNPGGFDDLQAKERAFCPRCRDLLKL